MNITVTIQVDGEEHEVERWLQRFSLGAESKAPTTAWTPALADRLVHRISPKAREVLKLMAENAPVISFEDIQEELETDGLGLGGVLASFGFAKRAGFPRPYTVDRKEREYHMDEQVAELMLDALRRYDED